MLPFFLFIFILISSAVSTAAATPTPTPWPEQFHSLLYSNQSGALQIFILWYDWPNGRNLNTIQYQLDKLLYSLEWNNGTSFFYTLNPSNHTYCHTKQFDVGLLPPHWLDGAHYLGQRTFDGFVCNVWEKAEFLLYYEDVETKRPVRWLFLDADQSVHVMTFEAGVVLEDAKWQAPVYCFNKEEQLDENHVSSSLPIITMTSMMRNRKLNDSVSSI